MREVSKSQAEQIRQFGMKYGLERESAKWRELGGFVLKGNIVTLEENQSSSPSNSFCCDWFKYPREQKIAHWHTHPTPPWVGWTDMLSPADYLHATQLEIPIIMFHPWNAKFKAGCWDYYDPSYLTIGKNLKPIAPNAGAFHPNNDPNLKMLTGAIAEINRAEKAIFDAWFSANKKIEYIKEKMKEVDEKTYQELIALSNEAATEEARNFLIAQATKIKFVGGFKKHFGGFQ